MRDPCENLQRVTQQTAEQWLCHLENSCTYKNYDEPKKLALCKVLLTGSAAAWFDALPDAVTGTWNALKERFLQRVTQQPDQHPVTAQLLPFQDRTAQVMHSIQYRTLCNE